jgi:hypothetical protein
MADTLNAFTQHGITNIAAGTTSVAATLNGVGDTAVVTNQSTGLAWVSFGASAQTAVAGQGYPVVAGGQRLIGIGGLVTQAAAILATGSATVTIEVGHGAFR